MKNLESIGFYTLSDKRAASSSITSPLSRCEMILTSRCNFDCPYCRHIGGKDIPYVDAVNTLNLWFKDNLKNIRFSGGEPTLYRGLNSLVKLCKENGVTNIAVSTNGSADWRYYRDLIDAGVNDFSISLDACCAMDGDKMAGNKTGAWEKVVENIEYLSGLTYVTVGVVLTKDNANTVVDIINYADSLGVSDIRIIPAAQEGDRLDKIEINQHLLNKYKILKYRIENINNNIPVRGNLQTTRCGLVLDDMAVMGNKHYPCIIYMRESGNPIGKISTNMRQERLEWYKTHDCTKDSICSKNCLDVCVHYNKKFQELNPLATATT
jgi:MoaA/NifB/PqqE/SkfB family radical SAM enzyme